MMRPWIARPGRLALLGLLLAVADPCPAQAPRPFVAPRDRAGWDARRDGLRRDVTRALEAGLPARPSAPRLEARGRESGRGRAVERIAIEGGSSNGGPIEGFLTLPEGAGPSRRVPVILLVGAPNGPARDAVEGPGLDGRVRPTNNVASNPISV